MKNSHKCNYIIGQHSYHVRCKFNSDRLFGIGMRSKINHLNAWNWLSSHTSACDLLEPFTHVLDMDNRFCWFYWPYGPARLDWMRYYDYNGFAYNCMKFMAYPINVRHAYTFWHEHAFTPNVHMCSVLEIRSRSIRCYKPIEPMF